MNGKLQWLVVLAISVTSIMRTSLASLFDLAALPDAISELHNVACTGTAAEFRWNHRHVEQRRIRVIVT